MGSSSISFLPAHWDLCMSHGGSPRLAERSGHDGQPWGESCAHLSIKSSSAVNSDDTHMGKQMLCLRAQSMMSVRFSSLNHLPDSSVICSFQVFCAWPDGQALPRILCRL